jgi:pyruvate/2-oxoglutarate dehydrogenase complex dihydrolipoamide acyltransferase (E2) component
MEPMRLNNLSMRDAQRLAREMGATVEVKRGTGELRFTHPLVDQHLLTSQSRDTASKALRAWLRRVHNTLEFWRALLKAIPGPGESEKTRAA